MGDDIKFIKDIQPGVNNLKARVCVLSKNEPQIMKNNLLVQRMILMDDKVKCLFIYIFYEF